MKKEKLSLFLFIDAFGWEIRKRHPFFLKDRTCDQKKLETILGYSSACDPSIISGRLPQEHLMWSSFYYDPDGSPFKWTRALAILPDAIFRRGRVRHYLSKLIKKELGFTGYFQLYGVPFKFLPLFNYAEKKRIWEPNGLLRGETIFDELHRQGIPHYVHDSAVNDETKLARLTADIESQRIDFAYCSLGKLDALMHAVGTQDEKVTELMHWYDKQLEKLIQTAEKHLGHKNWRLRPNQSYYRQLNLQDKKQVPLSSRNIVELESKHYQPFQLQLHLVDHSYYILDQMNKSILKLLR